jgi:hypothetical protein
VAPSTESSSTGATRLAHHLQVLVGLCSQLERTTEALLKHRELQVLPDQPGVHARLAAMRVAARRDRQWALTALAMSNLPEGVRHG